jgi:hypothetical protein
LDELKTFSDSEVESACKELKDFCVIGSHYRRSNSLHCRLVSQFDKHLSGFRDDEKEAYKEEHKKGKIQKTCSENIRAIKVFVHDTEPDRVAELFPQGKRGKKGNASFSINIKCDVTELEQALVDNDFDQIDAIYCGAFLADIENKVRANVWLSPALRDWIQTKRQRFAKQVSNTLLKLIRDSEHDNKRLTLAKDIQAFCEQCELNDDSLKQEIDKLLAPSESDNVSENPKTSVPEFPLPEPIHTDPENPSFSKPIHKHLLAKMDEDCDIQLNTVNQFNTHIHNYPENSSLNPSFPKHLRNHLLAKMDEDCDIQLKTVNQWINTHVSVETLKSQSKVSFPIRDSHQESIRLFQILFERSYGCMVLLGEAGMGKSLILYHLAKQLIEQAKDADEPIPLIFHLADWAMQSLSFEEWLKHELVQFGLAEKNIDADFQLLLEHKHCLCLFLLDGFDNLLLEQRLSHLQTINGFIQQHGEHHLGGIIIASRPAEYHFAKKLLLEESPSTLSHFHAEATIQALRVDESRTYIIDHTSPYRLPLDTWFESKAFKQLLNTPLGLILFVENAKSHQIDDNTETDINTVKNSLISTYIHNRFKRAEHHYQEKRQKLPYTVLEVTNWLGSLAKSMNIGGTFSVEGLSPKQILTDKQQYAYQWWFTVFFGLVFGAMMGSVAGLIFGKRVAQYASDDKPIMLPDAFMGIHQVLTQWINNDVFINKIGLVISYAGIGMVSAVLMSSLVFLLPKRIKRIRFPIFLGGYLSLSLGMSGWLVEGSQWALFVIIFYGILGILLGL